MLMFGDCFNELFFSVHYHLFLFANLLLISSEYYLKHTYEFAMLMLFQDHH